VADRWWRLRDQLRAIRRALEEHHGLPPWVAPPDEGRLPGARRRGEFDDIDAFVIIEFGRLRNRVAELKALLAQAEDYAREQGDAAAAAEAAVDRVRAACAELAGATPDPDDPLGTGIAEGLHVAARRVRAALDGPTASDDLAAGISGPPLGTARYSAGPDRG
jgi:hypothetical protein